MGVNGWTNWWFREANNVVWGNLGESGKTFFASSADDHWNFCSLLYRLPCPLILIETVEAEVRFMGRVH